MKAWIGFAGLCLFAGSEWVLAGVTLGGLAGGARLGTHYLLLAVLLGVVSCFVRGGWGRWGRIAGLGTVLIGAPVLVVGSASRFLGGASSSLVFMLVPAVVVFVAAQRAIDFGLEDRRLWALGPALLGIGGGGLIIPFTLPGSGVGEAWLGAVVASAVLAGIAAVLLHRELQGVGTLRAATLIGLGLSFVGFAFSGGTDWRGVQISRELLQTVLLDGPVLLLTVWLLRDLRPVSFSARFFFVPLVTLAGSYLAMRPSTSWITGFGMGLMALGGAGLIRGDSGEMP